MDELRGKKITVYMGETSPRMDGVFLHLGSDGWFDAGEWIDPTMAFYITKSGDVRSARLTHIKFVDYAEERFFGASS